MYLMARNNALASITKYHPVGNEWCITSNVACEALFVVGLILLAWPFLSLSCNIDAPLPELRGNNM